MRILIPLLFAFLSIACDATSTEQPPTTTISPVAETATQPTKSTPTAEPASTLTACEIFTAADFNDATDCTSLSGPNSRENSRGGSSCSFSCSEPFAMLIITLGFSENGFASVIERRKNNPALESIAIEGTDGVTLQPQQYRFDVYKGKHSINFVVPDTGGDRKALGIKMAKLMVSRLP